MMEETKLEKLLRLGGVVTIVAFYLLMAATLVEIAIHPATH